MASCARVGDQLRLLPRSDVEILHVLLSAPPIVSEAELPRGLRHLLVAPGELAIGDLDELLRRIGDHLVLELRKERLSPDRITDDRVSVLRLASEMVLEIGLVASELGVQLFVGFLHPPTEERIVAVVELVPSTKRALERTSARGCVTGDGWLPPRFLRPVVDASLDDVLSRSHLLQERSQSSCDGPCNHRL